MHARVKYMPEICFERNLQSSGNDLYKDFTVWLWKCWVEKKYCLKELKKLQTERQSGRDQGKGLWGAPEVILGRASTGMAASGQKNLAGCWGPRGRDSWADGSWESNANFH